MKFSRQTTLRSQATVTGVGVHSGLPVSLTVGPASIDAGFIFVRAAPGGCEREVQATAESVISTEFATVLGDCDGPLVSTAEHVLAALRGMGIDNATIEIDGPEVPIMDGSAAPFVAAIDQAGILTQSAPRPHLRLRERCDAAVERRFRARRLVRELRGVRRRTAAQQRGPALRRRMRPPQGARRGRRSRAGRIAAAWRLSLGARRPQAQS